MYAIVKYQYFNIKLHYIAYYIVHRKWTILEIPTLL